MRWGLIIVKNGNITFATIGKSLEAAIIAAKYHDERMKKNPEYYAQRKNGYAEVWDMKTGKCVYRR